MVVIALLKTLILVLFFSISFAYKYSDFVYEKDYKLPNPPENILTKCEFLPIDTNSCNSVINDISLTSSEKDEFILALLNPNLYSPDFNFVKNWNDKIVYSKYPLNPPKSSISIKDAWVKIITFHPSVLENNVTLLNKTGIVKSIYGFTFVLPNSTAASDCKTEYIPEGYDFNLITKLNGQTINHKNDSVANFTLNQKENLFDSILSIESGYLQLHFKNVRHCVETKKGEEKCTVTCDYSDTEEKKDNLVVTDNKLTSFYQADFNASYFVDSNRGGSYNVWLDYNAPEDFSSALFDADNVYLHKQNILYPLKSINNTLYFEIEALDETYKHNAYVLNSSRNSSNYSLNFLIPESDNCTFKLSSHFSSVTYDNFCVVSNDFPILNISLLNHSNSSMLVKIYFFDNQTKQVLQNKLIKLTYAGRVYNTTTNTNGEALLSIPYVDGSQIIYAKFDTDFNTKSAESSLIIPSTLPLSLLVSLGILFLLVLIIRRWFNGHA